MSLWLVHICISTMNSLVKKNYFFLIPFSWGDTSCWDFMENFKFHLYLASNFFKWSDFWNQREDFFPNTKLHQYTPDSQLCLPHFIITTESQRAQLVNSMNRLTFWNTMLFLISFCNMHSFRVIVRIVHKIEIFFLHCQIVHEELGNF